MCDCEELEFEDFEVILTALSKKSPDSEMQALPQAPLLQISTRKQRK